MSLDKSKFGAEFPRESPVTAETKDATLIQTLTALPHERLFDEQKATPEEWSDPAAWRKEDDGAKGLVTVRMTSQYGEYVRPLDGGRSYYRPSIEGKHLVDDVRDCLASAGFDISDRNSSANLYAEDFGTNLGRGLSPVDALYEAYDGEWCGKGTPEFRAMWPDRWPKGQAKPKQWDFEDLLGIKR